MPCNNDNNDNNNDSSNNNTVNERMETYTLKMRLARTLDAQYIPFHSMIRFYPYTNKFWCNVSICGASM